MTGFAPVPLPYPIVVCFVPFFERMILFEGTFVKRINASGRNTGGWVRNFDFGK